MKSIFINLKSVMHLLSKKDVNYLFILSFLILLTTVFETLSLSMIVPLVSFIGDVEFIENYPVIFDILSKFSSIFDLTTQNFTEAQKLMLGTSFIFSLFFLLRHIFFLIVTWKKEDFKFKMKTNFSDKMYSGYLKLPYSFHLKNNSSILVRNAVQEVEIFTNNVMQLITVFSDLIIKDLGKSFMPDKIIFLKDLPKTRNMKIMRRVIKSCLINEDPGDLSALLNPESVEEIKKHAI